MKLLRAISLGVLFWALVFVEWSIIMFAPVLKDLGNWQWLVHYFALIPIAVLGAWLYYKSNDKLNGFSLGAIFLVVGNLLDVVITVPLFIEGGYVMYYSNYYLWLGFLELIVITSIYGRVRAKKGE